MKITVIHPSRGRADQAFKTFLKWRMSADIASWEYILSIDEDDADNYKIFDREFNWHDSLPNGWERCNKRLISPNKSAIDAINNAAKIATGDLFIIISDDFSCPEHWDTLLLNDLNDKEDFLLKTNDGLQKTLVTLPIMDRKYYERFGYVYHEDYGHMHADEEMTIVALMLGRFINSDLVFPHYHYTTGAMQMDDINVKNNNTWAHGQATLNRRALNNFGIENPLIKREDIVWR